MAWKGKRWTGKQAKERAAAALYPVSTNRKLAPVEMQKNTTDRLRPVAVGPFVSSTYVSIKATCPDTCSFKGNGCYVTEGFTKGLSDELDKMADGMTGYEAIRQEAIAVESFARDKHHGGVPQDGGKHGKSGRDLRLHVGGDCPDDQSARRLALAAHIWREFGGGDVWTYTHNWKIIKCTSWGWKISVLASCENMDQVKLSRALGYAPSIVLPKVESDKAWKQDGFTMIPCPAERSKRKDRLVTCVECRLCLNSRALFKRKAVIVFEAHGIAAHKVRDTLGGKKVRRLTVVPT